MNHLTGKPSKAEAERITSMMILGCCACAFIGIPQIAEECHHIVEGNRRMGHWYSIPLCKGHHRGIWSPEQVICMPENFRVSLCDGSKAFESVYASERELWTRVQQRLHLSTDWPKSKMLPRRYA
jgi:Recombination enhancement, RecA-dependent nuclease